MKQKKVHISGVGDVLLEKSKRAKHMNLSIRPFRGVRVAVPRGVSFATAESFARSKFDWILKHLPKLEALERKAVQCRNEALAGGMDRKRAKDILIRRLEVLSAQCGLSYNRVFIKNQKTRWGSCSEKKNINLNVNLVRLPEELMDYAIMHELVHTKILNHSRQFWDLLEIFVKDAKTRDRELQHYSLFLVR